MKLNKKGQETFVGIFFGIFILLVVGGVLVMLLGFDKVEANHLGVMVRYGQIIGVQEPSLKWTGLFTQVYQYDMRVRQAEIELSGSNSAVDKTGQYVSATINVNYRLKRDPETVKKLYANIGTDPYIADVLNIDAIIKEGFKQTTTLYEALEILEKRQEVKEQAIENIRKNFPAEYFEITQIVVTNIDFSQSFKQAIENKKIAEQNAMEEENKLQVVIFQQKQDIEKFKAEAEKIRLQSQALTELTLRQKYLETWNGVLPMYMIANQDTINMFLPSPTLMTTPTGE